MIPVREVVKALGGEIYWDQVAQQVIIEYDSSVILLEISNDIGFINSESIALESRVCLWKERTMIPASFLPQAFDVAVDIESTSQTTIIINSIFPKTESPGSGFVFLPCHQRLAAEANPCGLICSTGKHRALLWWW